MAHPLRALLAAAFAITACSVVVSSQEECTDEPLVWTDPDGDGCDVYGRSGWCGAPWTENFATIGRTASQACCVCGGGLRITSGAPKEELSASPAKPASDRSETPAVVDHVKAPVQMESSKANALESEGSPAPAKANAHESERSPVPVKAKQEMPMVGSTSVTSMAVGSFRKDEVASLKEEVAELQNKLKDRDHMAATLEQATHEETHRAKAQESSLDSRLSKLEDEFHSSQQRLSNATPTAPPQQAWSEITSSEAVLKAAEDADTPAANQESAELMDDVGQLHGLVREAQVKLRGMSQEIAGLRVSVQALGGH